MDVLIIGNGFDLANNMQTRYSDFLKFAARLRKIFTNEEIAECQKCREDIERIIDDKCGNISNNLFSRRAIIDDIFFKNVWIDYFTIKVDKIPDRWVDFEEEIGCVIHSLYDGILCGSKKGYPWSASEMIECIQVYYEEMDVDKEVSPEMKMEYYISILEEHLIKLEKALEFYLREFVMSAEINVNALDVKEILDNNHETQIISFNYTDTLEKYYFVDEKNIIYVHGKLGNDDEYNKTDLVLGVDDEDKDLIMDQRFLSFYKYCRREVKGASHRTKLISSRLMQQAEVILAEKKFLTEDMVQVEMINGGDKDYQTVYSKQLSEFEKKRKKDNLYIYGHSLAVSDREYLMEFLTNDQIRITIFYHDEQQKTDQIKNLVSMLGRNRFVDFTSRDRIVFCKQKEVAN